MPEGMGGSFRGWHSTHNRSIFGTAAFYAVYIAKPSAAIPLPDAFRVYRTGPSSWPGGSKTLCALNLPERVVGGLVAAPSGTLPLNPAQMRSLFEVFRLMTDPPTGGAEFRIGGVFTLTAMAILCGACDISQIARFATRLRPKQRAHLGMPRKTGTQAFYRVPSYSVFYQVLKRMDAEEFARRLCSWLQAAAGTLPGALALDGKTITADALHCQKETARLIVEKGGDFPLQIKANFLAISLASLAR